MDYNEIIDYQKNNLPFGIPKIQKDDVWEFDFSTFKDDLLRSINFYIECIEHNSYYLKIPCSVVFSTDQSVNAMAGVYDDRGMIIYSAGLLLKQCDVLEQWRKIENAYSTSELGCILKYLDNHVSILLYQIILDILEHTDPPVLTISSVI